MSITMKTLILILSLIVVIYICSWSIPRLVRSLKRKVFSFRSKKNSDVLTNSFLKEEQPGKFFVRLLGVGLFRSIKTINHGEVFPDEQQVETFRYYGTPAINKALDEIGDGV